MALGVTPEFHLTKRRADPDDTAVDEAFYRGYKRMPLDAKRRLRQILGACDEDR